ncbi:MAG: hypothetical protein DRJ98_05625 [Thermoprotei archaeon]|nr:MAG: hypothetical protein DRJ98_05625 [Thermoprotei archaeon]
MVSEQVRGLTVFSSSPACHWLGLALAVRASSKGNVLYIDGWNTANIYELYRLAELEGLGEEALRRILISRAFTAYQLLTLLQRLEENVERFSPILLVLAEPVRLFLDEDVPRREGIDMFASALGKLRAFIKRSGVSVAAFTALSPEDVKRRRSVFINLLVGAADQHVRVEEKGKVVRLEWVKPSRHVLEVSFNREFLYDYL